jgi:hypothetical protein
MEQNHKNIVDISYQQKTYIVLPEDLVVLRVGLDGTLQVDVTALLQRLGLQLQAQLEGHHWSICM